MGYHLGHFRLLQIGGMIAEGGDGMKGKIAEGEPPTGKNVLQLVVVAFYIALLTGMAAVLDIDYFSLGKGKRQLGALYFLYHAVSSSFE